MSVLVAPGVAVTLVTNGRSPLLSIDCGAVLGVVEAICNEDVATCTVGKGIVVVAIILYIVRMGCLSADER